MSREEMEAVAHEAADNAVKKVFLTVGVDLTDPKAVIRFQDNLRFLGNWQESTQAVKRKALLTAVGVIITGALGYLFLAARGHP